MTSIAPQSLPQSQESWREQLQALSHPGILNRHLIVKKGGTLTQTNFLEVLWEKFKGLWKLPNWTNSRLVEFETLEFLAQGKNWVKTQKDIENVNVLAKRVGLTPSTIKDHPDLQTLVTEVTEIYESIDEIGQSVLNKPIEEESESLLNNFFNLYKKELTPFALDIPTIRNIFKKVIASEEKSKNEARENEAGAEETDTSTTPEEGKSQGDQQPSIQIETIAIEAAPIPTSITAIKPDPSLLNIPPSKAASTQPTTGPLFSTSTEEVESIKKMTPAEASKIQTPDLKKEIKVKVLKRDVTSRQWPSLATVAKVALGTIGLVGLIVAGVSTWQNVGSGIEIPKIDSSKSIFLAQPKEGISNTSDKLVVPNVDQRDVVIPQFTDFNLNSREIRDLLSNRDIKYYYTSQSSVNTSSLTDSDANPYLINALSGSPTTPHIAQADNNVQTITELVIPQTTNENITEPVNIAKSTTPVLQSSRYLDPSLFSKTPPAPPPPLKTLNAVKEALNSSNLNTSRPTMNTNFEPVSEQAAPIKQISRINEVWLLVAGVVVATVATGLGLKKWFASRNQPVPAQVPPVEVDRAALPRAQDKPQPGAKLEAQDKPQREAEPEAQDKPQREADAKLEAEVPREAEPEAEVQREAEPEAQDKPQREDETHSLVKPREAQVELEKLPYTEVIRLASNYIGNADEESQAFLWRAFSACLNGDFSCLGRGDLKIGIKFATEIISVRVAGKLLDETSANIIYHIINLLSDSALIRATDAPPIIKNQFSIFNLVEPLIGLGQTDSISLEIIARALDGYLCREDSQDAFYKLMDACHEAHVSTIDGKGTTILKMVCSQKPKLKNSLQSRVTAYNKLKKAKQAEDAQRAQTQDQSTKKEEAQRDMAQSQVPFKEELEPSIILSQPQQQIRDEDFAKAQLEQTLDQIRPEDPRFHELEQPSQIQGQPIELDDRDILVMNQSGISLETMKLIKQRGIIPQQIDLKGFELLIEDEPSLALACAMLALNCSPYFLGPDVLGAFRPLINIQPLFVLEFMNACLKNLEGLSPASINQATYWKKQASEQLQRQQNPEAIAEIPQVLALKLPSNQLQNPYKVPAHIDDLSGQLNKVKPKADELIGGVSLEAGNQNVDILKEISNQEKASIPRVEVPIIPKKPSDLEKPILSPTSFGLSSPALETSILSSSRFVKVSSDLSASGFFEIKSGSDLSASGFDVMNLSGRSPEVIINENERQEKLEKQQDEVLKQRNPNEGMRGKVVAGFNTAKELVKAWWNKGLELEYDPHPNPTSLQAQQRIATPGTMLAGSDVCAFIDAIKLFTPLNTIEDFYIKENTSINTYNFQDVRDIILEARKNFLPNTPICIPIILGTKNPIERNHIVLILINNGVIAYYDAKGVGSLKHKLADGTILRNVLEECQSQFGNMPIVENKCWHQIDAHNCGVFVCREIYKSVVEPLFENEKKVPGVQPLKFHQEDLNAFRNLIIAQAYPLPNNAVMQALVEKSEDTEQTGSEEAYEKLSEYVKKSLAKNPMILQKLSKDADFSNSCLDRVVTRLTKLMGQRVLADIKNSTEKKYEDYYVNTLATDEQKVIIESLRKKFPKLALVEAKGDNPLQKIEIDVKNNHIRLQNQTKFTLKGLKYSRNGETNGKQKIGTVTTTRTISLVLSDFLKLIFKEMPKAELKLNKSMQLKELDGFMPALDLSLVTIDELDGFEKIQSENDECEDFIKPDESVQAKKLDKFVKVVDWFSDLKLPI